MNVENLPEAEFEPLVPLTPLERQPVQAARNVSAPRVPELMWRDGKKLVLRKGAALPARCIKCNGEPAGRPLLRTLSWHEPWVFVLVAVSPIIYVIVALITRKQAKLYVPLCATHRARRRMHMLIGALIAAAGLGMIVPAVVFDAPALILVIILLFLGGLIYLLAAQQPVRAARIDDHLVHIRGVCPEFLDGLPPFSREVEKEVRLAPPARRSL